MQPFPTVPIPEWKFGKSVSMDSLKSVTDAYVKALEPKRKLKLPVLPAQVTDSLASFTRSIKQEKSLPEVQEMLIKALAEKAVVEEDGKVLDGFKVSSGEGPGVDRGFWAGDAERARPGGAVCGRMGKQWCMA